VFQEGVQRCRAVPRHGSILGGRLAVNRYCRLPRRAQSQKPTQTAFGFLCALACLLDGFSYQWPCLTARVDVGKASTTTTPSSPHASPTPLKSSAEASTGGTRTRQAVKTSGCLEARYSRVRGSWTASNLGDGVPGPSRRLFLDPNVRDGP